MKDINIFMERCSKVISLSTLHWCLGANVLWCQPFLCLFVFAAVPPSTVHSHLPSLLFASCLTFCSQPQCPPAYTGGIQWGWCHSTSQTEQVTPRQAYPVAYIIKSLILCLAFQNLPNLAPAYFVIRSSPHFLPSLLCIAPFLAILQSLNIRLFFWFHAFVQTTSSILWPSPYWSASSYRSTGNINIFFQTLMWFSYWSS